MPYCKTMPGSQQKHHVLYVLNKYRATFDVLDSFDWSSHKELSRSSFHAADVKEIVCCIFFCFFSDSLCRLNILVLNVFSLHFNVKTGSKVDLSHGRSLWQTTVCQKWSSQLDQCFKEAELRASPQAGFQPVRLLLYEVCFCF